jgi:hypothetical protein
MSAWSSGVRHALLPLLAISASWPAAARTDGGQTVSVRFKPSYAICAGVCPWFEAQVDPRGGVTIRQFAISEEREEVIVSEITSFLASPAQAAAFRTMLEPLRPTADREADAHCAQALQQDGTPDPLDQPRKDDVLIVWRSGARSTRLTACLDNQAVHGAVQRAVAALGLYPDGRRPE